MIRFPARLAGYRHPGILALLLTRGFDAALTAVCSFSAFSVLSSH